MQKDRGTIIEQISAREFEAWLLGQNFVDSREAGVALVDDTSPKLHHILQAHTMRMNESISNDFLDATHARGIALLVANTAAAADQQPGTQYEMHV